MNMRGILLFLFLSLPIHADVIYSDNDDLTGAQNGLHLEVNAKVAQTFDYILSVESALDTGIINLGVIDSFDPCQLVVSGVLCSSSLPERNGHKFVKYTIAMSSLAEIGGANQLVSTFNLIQVSPEMINKLASSESELGNSNKFYAVNVKSYDKDPL